MISTAGKFRYSSIPMAKAVNWHLQRSKGGTRSQFSTHNATHLCLMSQVSAMRIPEGSRYQHLPVHLIKFDSYLLTERDVADLSGITASLAGVKRPGPTVLNRV